MLTTGPAAGKSLQTTNKQQITNELRKSEREKKLTKKRKERQKEGKKDRRKERKKDRRKERKKRMKLEYEYTCCQSIKTNS